MLTITFADGRQLECESVHSRPKTYNGTNRDSYIFIFPDTVGLIEVVSHFTPENCKKIWLEDESGEKFLHEHYTIRLEAGIKERGALLQAGEDNDHRTVTYIQMVRTTYSEQQLEELSDTMDTLIIAQLMGGNDNG